MLWETPDDGASRERDAAGGSDNLQVTVYVHPPMQDANDIEGGGRKTIEHKMLADGAFEISLAGIDLATGPCATSKIFDRFQQVTVVTVCLFA